MKISILHIGLLFISLIFNAVIGGNLSIESALLLFTFTFSSSIIGKKILSMIGVFTQDSLASTFLGFAFGSASLMFAMPFLNTIDESYMILINLILFISTLLYLYVTKSKNKINFIIEWIDIIEILLLMIVFYLFLAAPEYRSNVSLGNKDPMYFTTVVASLNVAPTLLTLNEVGSHINYQLFSFFTPATLAKLTNITSHVALWNITMPFYAVLFGLMLSTLLRELSALSYVKSNYAFCAILIFVGLTPLHIKNFISLNWLELYLPGIGSLLPGGNPPVTFALSVTLFIVLILLKIGAKKLFGYKYLCLIAFLTALILPIKTAAFPATASFVVLYYLLSTRQLFKSVVLSLLIVVLAYCGYKISNPISGVMQINVAPGYLFEFFGKSDSLTKNLVVTISFIGTFLLFKVILFIYVKFKFAYKNYTLNFMIASVLALCISLLLPLLIRAYIFDNDGTILQDVSFDTLQFPRFGFFIISVVATMVAWQIIKSPRHKYAKIIIVSYSILLMISVFNYSITHHSNLKRETYYDIVENEIKANELKMELLAAFASDDYKAQVFVADEFAMFYVSSKRSLGGYAMTIENTDRWKIMDDLENALITNNSVVFRDQLQLLKNKNVKAIVFHPDNIDLLNDTFNSFFITTENRYLKIIK